MDLTRKQVIELLEYQRKYGKQIKLDVYDALDYAISSLKTDEAYQLMYEGGEIFTKADLVAMLKDLRLEIEEIFDNRPLPCSHYQRTLFYGEVDDLILDKINALKG